MNKQKGWINEKKKIYETKALLQLQCAHSAKILDVQWYILKEKKCTNERLKKNNNNNVATVATVPLGTVATVQNFFFKKR